MKHGNGNVWGCFSSYNQRKTIRRYTNQNLVTSVKVLEMKCNKIFQLNNNPTHNVNTIKQRFENNKTNLLKWSSQSPNLNPTENLCPCLLVY